MMNRATRIRSGHAGGRRGRAARSVGCPGSRGPARAGVSRSPARSPRARAWTRTLPSAVASTGPATTGSSQASAVSWQRSVVAGAAADEVDDLDRLPGQPGRVARRSARTPRRGCRGCSGRAPARDVGAGCPSRRQAACDPRRHVARRQEGRVVGVEGRAAGGQLAGGDRAAPAGLSGVPASSQVRSDSWSSHRPITLRRKRIRSSTPPSFVKFAARLASVRTAASSSTPTSDQVPQAM